MRTSSEEVSIHAVSPLLATRAGAAAAAAGAAAAVSVVVVWPKAAPAQTTAPARPRESATRAPREVRMDFMRCFPVKGMKESESVRAFFAGADADRLVERRDENLAVADLAGAGDGSDRVNDAVGHFRRDPDLDLQLRQEADGIFGPAVDLR